MDNKGKLLTVSEVAELLRLSPAAVYALTYRRQIPFIRIGRRLRYDYAQVRQWIEGQSVTQSSQSGDDIDAIYRET